jgi:hypothetical protein
MRDLHDLAVMLVILMSICSAVMPSFGPGHLEIHVAEVILVAQDVGQHREARAFLDRGPWRCRPPAP